MRNLEKLIFTLAFIFAISLVHAQPIESLGALEFSSEGILFAGDNLSGAVHAIDLRTESRKKKPLKSMCTTLMPR